MSTVLRLVICDPRDDSREQLKNLLLGIDMVWLEADCSRYEFFPDVVAQTTPEVAILNIDTDPDKALAILETIRTTTPQCSILIASRRTDGPLILRAMRGGAKEFLTSPVTIDELMSALSRVIEQTSGSGPGGPRGCKIIAVAGGTGGVGCTSLAVNIGANLAANSQNSAVLVDMDLALGDADVYLDTIPDYSLVDVTQNVSRLDFQLLRKSLTKHSSGLYLLPRPVQLQDVSLITADSLRKVFGLLRASFSHIVVDISKSYTEVDLAALELANEILLVVQLDLPCLRNMVRLLMSFEEMENIREKVKIVVNRVGLESGQISLKKARETIGRDVYFQIPNDYKTMSEMRNNGVPLSQQAPKAPITQSIQQLTNMLTNTVETAETAEGETAGAQPASSWMSFWPGKGAKAKPKK
jgi:pilus assembly protein CpaE